MVLDVERHTAGRHYTGTIAVRYAATSVGLPPEIEIRTDRLTLRPTTDDERTIGFYQRALYGCASVMAKFADGAARTPPAARRRVHDLAERWRAHDHGSSFVVSWTQTHELLGHTILGHGDAPGETEFAILLKASADDGSPLWNRGIGREVTAAMLMGWAPFLARRSLLVVNDADGRAHPVTILTATVRKDNVFHRHLAKLLLDDPTNERMTFESQRWGSTRTHFFTTPEAMQALRERLVVDVRRGQRHPPTRETSLST